MTATVADKFWEDILAAPEQADALAQILADFCEDEGDRGRAEILREDHPFAFGFGGEGWRVEAARETTTEDDAQKGWKVYAVPNVPLETLDAVCRDMPELWNEREASIKLCSCVTRRGMVREATLPLAVWMEHGPALVRKQPVAKLTLLGVAPSCPSQIRNAAGWHHTYTTVSSRYFTDHVPYSIWALLSDAGRFPWQGGATDEDFAPGWKLYASIELALAALNDAALRWARSKR